jgi:hypothetical protein
MELGLLSGDRQFRYYIHTGCSLLYERSREVSPEFYENYITNDIVNTLVL